MNELIKATHRVCNRCRYSMGFGSQPCNAEAPDNICCNYMEIRGESRIFKDGKMAYNPAYCDKYEKGKRIVLKMGRKGKILKW